ncbi:DctQ6 [Desulforapulum autotrophicum HRM2]|uniref:DctQ6 n=1 Tax=Desulforapulum autotrophicum (strain ATCC 43914 / DSM 3382 / VKM B-1955 / HRM2) TaxID=177437 RepID=C0QAW1_DESAH|nr:TRAP transporter small permease subunit [Desulforapulum autotrophicum]ACN16894.1 DctQ6 [Desulforapulum autotrophicum HRM2]
MRRVLAIIDSVSEMSGRLISFLIYPLAFLLLYDVVMRFAFNSPTIWCHELALHLFGAYAVLAGPYVLLHDEHVKIDIVYNYFSPRGRAIIDCFTYPIFFMFIGLLFWYGGVLGIRAFELNQTVSPSPWASPLWPTKLTVPLAAFLMLAQGLAHYIRTLTLAFTGKELS